jgi:sensor c-di-GMP phosphodiesterase-like protein
MFLVRFGDHDVAIDPRGLLDVGQLQQRQVELWMEGRSFAREPANAKLPRPDSIAVGLTLDRRNGRAISRFSQGGEFPIEVVAIEPLGDFWSRYASTLIVGTGIGLVLVAGWLFFLMRYTRHRLSLASMLRAALANQRLHVVYQPIVDLHTGKCVGAEALARWTMEGGAQVSPESFVPVAELTGQTTELALAVLRTTLRELSPVLKEKPHLSVTINLSAAELTSDRFSRELDSHFPEGGFPRGAIGFELTERALIGGEASSAIARLRERGHRVSIDDFGTGYSSLSYLKDFALDGLKVDKAFIHSIGTEAATSQVIAHVIEMAQTLGLRTVAEGVETAEQRNWLRDHGVDYGQGWVFSRPLTAADFITYVREEKQKKPKS